MGENPVYTYRNKLFIVICGFVVQTTIDEIKIDIFNQNSIT
jgi:hypothetical protein